MSFTIRKAFSEDVGKVKPYMEKFNLDIENLNSIQLYIAEIECKLVGFGRCKNYEKIYEIASVGVLEDFRGKGIGKALVNYIIENIPSEEIWITTIIPEFFIKFNFEVCKNPPEEIQQKVSRLCSKFNRHIYSNVFMRRFK